MHLLKTVSILVVSLMVALPAHAKTFLIYTKDKATKRTNDYPTMVWHSNTLPIAGRNCPPESTIIELPAHLKSKPIQELKRDGFVAIKHEPKQRPASTPSLEQETALEIKETLRDAATDDTITDEQYARLLRISNIDDSAKKKAEWDKIKNEVKKK